MSLADRWTRAVTIAVVVVVGLVAAYVSYRHIFDLAITHGEDQATAYALPVTVDGPMLAASLVLLDAARHKLPAHPWAWVTLLLGIAASGTANVLHGWHHGIIGAVLAAWPSIMLALSVELLLRLLRGHGVVEQVRAPVEQVRAPEADAEVVEAARLFAHAESVPSLREIRTAVRCGWPKARRVQAYLSGLSGGAA